MARWCWCSRRNARRDVSSEKPVWVTGVGWSQDAPSLESREWGEARYLRLAAERAYAMAGIRAPRRTISLAEVNDTYAYKELQHLEALKLARPGEAGVLVEEGATEPDGDMPVNVSAGSSGAATCSRRTALRRRWSGVATPRRSRGTAGRRRDFRGRGVVARRPNVDGSGGDLRRLISPC